MKHMKRFAALFVALALVVTLFAACGKSVEKQIIGSWRDSSGGFGLDLKKDGIARIVALDYSLFGVDLKQGQDATYVISKGDDGVNTITLSFKIVVQINLEFTFTLEDDVLTLNPKNSTILNKSFTLTRVDSPEATSANS